MNPVLVLLAGDDATYARAEAVLVSAERAKLAGYQQEKRRRDWLLGRLSGKTAVARGVGRDCGLDEVEIRSEENGHPVATVEGHDLSSWDLSLTHGHGHAAALFGPSPLGIDLERLREVALGGWRFFLTEGERAWLADEPLGPRGDIVAWALKEAAYKAVQGRTAGMHYLTLDEVAEGRARIGHDGSEGPLAARYVVGERFCLAIATPQTQAGDWFESIEFPALDTF